MAILFCIDCKQWKDESEFHRNSKSKSGRRPECKRCSELRREKSESKDLVRAKCKRMAQSILRRLKDTSNKRNKCYENVECRIGKTAAEIEEYLYNNFYDDIKMYIDNGVVCSVDRIDSNGHYEHGNIRIISWYENSKMGAKRAAYKTSKPVQAEDLQGNVKVFESVSQAARYYKIKRDTVLRSIQKDKRTRYGIKFSYCPIR